MRIIPAIDIINGKCVRLTKGDYSTKKIYNENPVEVAKAFEDNGIQYLHIVDLDGAKEKRIINHVVLETVATKTNLKIDFGGGIRSDEDIHIAFESGACQITAGSVAVTEPDLFSNWLTKYGCEKIILGADFKNGKIAIQGWSETSDTDLIQFITEKNKRGIKYVICTDIDKDGMMNGPSTQIYKDILAAAPVNLIAGGGITSMEDIEAVALDRKSVV